MSGVTAIVCTDGHLRHHRRLTIRGQLALLCTRPAGVARGVRYLFAHAVAAGVPLVGELPRGLPRLRTWRHARPHHGFRCLLQLLLLLSRGGVPVPPHDLPRLAHTGALDADAGVTELRAEARGRPWTGGRWGSCRRAAYAWRVARAERSTEYIARSGQTAETGILSIKGQPVHNVVHLEASSALTEGEIVERHDRLDRELFDADPRLSISGYLSCALHSLNIYTRIYIHSWYSKETSTVQYLIYHGI